MTPPCAAVTLKSRLPNLRLNLGSLFCVDVSKDCSAFVFRFNPNKKSY